MEIPFDDVNNDEPNLRILKAYYKIIKVIGKGAFGIVYKAFELCSGRRVAIKQIKIDTENKNLVLKEIEVLKKVEHQNIVQYFNFLKEDNYIFIIMEFLEGGTLKEYIQENKDNITEEIASEIIKQILNALSYLHYSCDVCHRDVKPENIMFSEKNNISSLKLLDFGLSSDSFESKLRMQNCGTLTYMAPEQISGVVYSKAVDIWSVGIILYMLLNKGKNAFYEKGDTAKFIIDKINNKEISFDLDKCPISPIGRHLIYKLLDKNPSYRYSARLALNHPWITKNKMDKIPLTLYDKLLFDENSIKLKMIFLVSSFMSFYKKKFLKKKCLKYVTCKSEKLVNEQFKNKFKKIDYSDNQKFYYKLSSKEKINNNNQFNLDEYEKKLLKTNYLMNEKYLEEREKMFIPENTVSDDNCFMFLKTYRIKLGQNKKEKGKENKTGYKDVKLKINIDREINNENIEKKNDIEIENDLINSSQRLESIDIHNQPVYKLKKTTINDQSPTNLKYFNEKGQNFKDSGKTPDINYNNKKYGKKLSSKLISFRLSNELKHQKSKYVLIQNGKDKFEKPIKLQSLKNNNNFLLNKSKKNNTMANKDLFNNNHNLFETISTKISLSKNIEKLKKHSSMEKIERNYKGAKHLKVSNSIEAKENIDIDNTDKKIIYKSMKIKDEYKNLDDKINMYSAKHNVIPQVKLARSTLTSTRKSKNGRSNSIDNSRFIQPKKLFQNNYFLPPIKK